MQWGDAVNSLFREIFFEFDTLCRRPLTVIAFELQYTCMHTKTDTHSSWSTKDNACLKVKQQKMREESTNKENLRSLFGIKFFKFIVSVNVTHQWPHWLLCTEKLL